MAVNKVIYGGNTVIDLTGDTVTADKLVTGAKAHDKSGATITGTNPYEKTATDTEVASQTDLISQIATALEGKAAGGGGTVETCSFSATYAISFTVIYTTGSGEPAWAAGYDETVTVEVMKNTIVTFWTDSGRCGYSCTGDVSLFYGNDSFGPVVLHVTGDGTFTPYLD